MFLEISQVSGKRAFIRKGWIFGVESGRLRQLEASEVPGHAVLRNSPIGPFTVAGSLALNPFALQ